MSSKGCTSPSFCSSFLLNRPPINSLQQQPMFGGAFLTMKQSFLVWQFLGSTRAVFRRLLSEQNKSLPLMYFHMANLDFQAAIGA